MVVVTAFHLRFGKTTEVVVCPGGTTWKLYGGFQKYGEIFNTLQQGSFSIPLNP